MQDIKTREIKIITRETTRAIALVLTRMIYGELPLVTTNLVLDIDREAAKYTISLLDQEVIYSAEGPIETAIMLTKLETPEVIEDILGKYKEDDEDIPIIVDCPAINSDSSSKHP